MKTIRELRQLKEAVTNSIWPYPTHSAYIEFIAVIDQAIEQQETINTWYEFMSIMATRSSWGEQIQSLLDKYLYGTNDETTIKAIKRYLDTSRSLDIDT